LAIDESLRISQGLVIMEPANSIIKLCGGFSAVAELLCMSEIQVRKWTYPVDRGGTGGFVPTKRQASLMDAAKSVGIDLTPDHFFGRAAS
jgi:hypothetical protein